MRDLKSRIFVLKNTSMYLHIPVQGLYIFMNANIKKCIKAPIIFIYLMIMLTYTEIISHLLNFC